MAVWCADSGIKTGRIECVHLVKECPRSLNQRPLAPHPRLVLLVVHGPTLKITGHHLLQFWHIASPRVMLTIFVARLLQRVMLTIFVVRLLQ